MSHWPRRSWRSRAMRVRSSSAPSERSRPNRRALSSVSASTSARPPRRRRSRSSKWSATGCSSPSRPTTRLRARSSTYMPEPEPELMASPTCAARLVRNIGRVAPTAAASAGGSSFVTLVGRRTHPSASFGAHSSLISSYSKRQITPGWNGRRSSSRMLAIASRWLSDAGSVRATELRRISRSLVSVSVSSRPATSRRRCSALISCVRTKPPRITDTPRPNANEPDDAVQAASDVAVDERAEGHARERHRRGRRTDDVTPSEGRHRDGDEDAQVQRTTGAARVPDRAAQQTRRR